MYRLLSLKLFGFRLRTLALAAVLGLIGIAALGLDLTHEGRVYHYLWTVTGETKPDQQILGFAQYLMRFTREQPDTQPFARLDHNDVNPFGVNTLLDQEVEPEKRERQVQMIADAGFHWIRQQFRWEDLEIDGKGDFIDRRHDRDGDGINDAISAWDKYDNIVDLTEQYGLDIIVRLGVPPKWSWPEGATIPTPPADTQDFVDYATAVATHYEGRLRYYQVWNEPNLYPEWGDQTVNAEAYTDMLCRTYSALKTIDPQIVVITGALGPTVDLSGRNAYDLLYLQRMYQAGAGACFDVLSVQGYGLWSGPTDQRLRPTTINFQRQLWLRDMMVNNGDANKPIWISEAGWNPVPDDPSIVEVDRYGRVTMDQAAEWAPLAYERALDEWPWIGVISWWYFKPADDHDRGDSSYYFRLVEPDFTPTPVYDALSRYLNNSRKPIGPGRYGPARADAKILVSEATGIAIYKFSIDGTGLYLGCNGNGMQLPLQIDGKSFDGIDPYGCGWVTTSLKPGVHEVELSFANQYTLEEIVVVDYSLRQRLPWLLVGGLAALAVIGVLGAAIRARPKGTGRHG